MKNPQQTDCPLGPAGLSVVVPVYNSEAFLSELVARIRPVLEKTASTYELILVNDGSRDGSWRVIEELAGRHDWIRGINLMRNFGQHNALLCGIRAARHGIIVTMDDDLQNPPEEIPKLLGGLAGGVDVVYGVPEKSEQGLWRRVSSWMFRAALRKAMGVEAASYASAFRAFRTHIRDAFEQYNHPSVSVDVLLSWGTTGFSRVCVEHHARSAGRSNYNLRKLAAHAFNIVSGFSTAPLHLASLAGLSFTVLGIVLLAYVLARYVAEGGSVPGFPFLASVIIIFSGVQLFCLGIFGGYLGRIFHRTLQCPTYLVRSSVPSGNTSLSSERDRPPIRQVM
jgi:undecaprenyl-phosphate 4-deoxy-4-formamido-L-arabinose transferase